MRFFAQPRSRNQSRRFVDETAARNRPINRVFQRTRHTENVFGRANQNAVGFPDSAAKIGDLDGRSPAFNVQIWIESRKLRQTLINREFKRIRNEFGDCFDKFQMVDSDRRLPEIASTFFTVSLLAFSKATFTDGRNTPNTNGVHFSEAL